MPDNQPATGILHKTLGEIVRNNPQAQQMIMQSMQITPQQFQELLQQTGNNQLMNMTISDLFKNGIMQQSMQMQHVSPEQMQQMLGMQVPIEEAEIIPAEEKVSYSLPKQPKQSFFQKIKQFFS